MSYDYVHRCAVLPPPSVGIFSVSTRHPWTERYFKSSKSVRIEQQEHQTATIHPFSVFNYYVTLIATPLDLIIMLFNSFVFAMYTSEDMPLAASFLLDVIGVIWSIEIVLRFFTGYVTGSNRRIELRLNHICWNYCRTWLAVDVGALAGIYLQQYNARFLALLSILSLPRFMQNLRIFAEAFHVKAMKYRMLRLFVMVSLCTHLLTCLYSFVGVLATEETITPFETYQVMLNFVCWRIFGQSIKHINLDDLDAHYKFNRLVLIMFAYAFHIFVFVEILDIVNTMNVSKRTCLELLNQWNSYMSLKQFPKKLQERMRFFFTKKYGGRYFNETEILRGVSDQLRDEIMMHHGKLLIDRVAEFNGLPEEVVRGIVSRFKVEHYLPNDTIITSSSFGSCMYFIGYGTVAISTGNGKEVWQLEDGDHFGEIVLLLPDQRRKSNATAVDFCELYRLDQKDFSETIQSNPELFHRFEMLALQRLDVIVATEEEYKKQLEETTASV